jgi:NAD(P)-dependent dehydrogenase (short-subunit alcohol dehydrogenase family)
MSKLTGKVALITGGNSGIGLATAKTFLQEGAKVIITGRNKSTLDQAKKELGDQVLALESDVSDLGALDRLYAELKGTHGKIDILFANAGVALMAPLSDVTPEFFDQHFNINVKGLFFTVQKALPLLNDGASIILNASVVASKGIENFSVYSATKAAVRSLARSFANDLRSRQIRVNAISPGPIETPIFGKMGLPAEVVQGMGEAFAAQVPLGRFGQADEIAKAALFLASSDSSYVTGIELSVDGGLGQV